MAREVVGPVERFHLVVDIVGDGTDPEQLGRQLLAGRRPDALLVDCRPQGRPNLRQVDAIGGQAFNLAPCRVYIVAPEQPELGEPAIGLVLPRPTFVWAHTVHALPQPVEAGLARWDPPAEYRHLEFGGQVHRYGMKVADPGGEAVLLEDLSDMAGDLEARG
ncbi:MAG TPA: hypothetical protein VK507_19130 [Iamia sp.]|nr:hypothetical protein [Iamia sp.]